MINISINVDAIARALFKIEKSETRKGRTPDIYRKEWEELTDEEVEEYRRKIRNAYEAMLVTGQFNQQPRKTVAFRSAIKRWK